MIIETGGAPTGGWRRPEGKICPVRALHMSCYNWAMSQATSTAVLEKLLDPLARSFTPEMARVIAEFQADPSTQALVDDLARKCNEGELTEREKLDYEAYVRAGNLVAVLKAKAKAALAAKS